MEKIKPVTAISIAKNMICAYLSTSMNAEGMSVIYEIRSGNKKLLLEHTKALRNIFDMAIKELEGEYDREN